MLHAAYFRRHAETCLRLAIASSSPDNSKLLIAIAGEWLADAAEAEIEAVDRSSSRVAGLPASLSASSNGT